mgnify:CR=1 FL=1|jgi:hypothetical protein
MSWTRRGPAATRMNSTGTVVKWSRVAHRCAANKHENKNHDEFVKTLILLVFVIPAKAGIQ